MAAGDGRHTIDSICAVIVQSRELLPLIRDALMRGQRLRIVANGSSMLPFIHDGDIIELQAARSRPRLGDIVLVEGPGDLPVVHRVVRVAGATFTIRGDAQTATVGPLAENRVLATVVTSYRHKQVRSHDHGIWRLAGLLWLSSAPLGCYLIQALFPLWKAGRSARSWLHQM